MALSTAPTASSAQAEAERAAVHLIEGVRRRAGRLWDEGARKVPIPDAPKSDALAWLCRRRLRGTPEPVVAGLVAWSRGLRPAIAVDAIPASRQVLAWQAAGLRCVSLVDDATAHAHGDPRHPDGASFAIHDLCHLEKFVAPEHHRGQVGFFRSVLVAVDAITWGCLEDGLDAEWASDRDYVFADMNGSAIFLFAALKMKLRMAVRRRVARRRGSHPRPGGDLDADEQRAFEAAQDLLLAALDLHGELAEAGRQVSAKRDNPSAALHLLRAFEARALDPAGR